jgi:hypothetical protein
MPDNSTWMAASRGNLGEGKFIAKIISWLKSRVSGASLGPNVVVNQG